MGCRREGKPQPLLGLVRRQWWLAHHVLPFHNHFAINIVTGFGLCLNPLRRLPGFQLGRCPCDRIPMLSYLVDVVLPVQRVQRVHQLAAAELAEGQPPAAAPAPAASMPGTRPTSQLVGQQRQAGRVNTVPVQQRRNRAPNRMFATGGAETAWWSDMRAQPELSEAAVLL